MEGRDAALSEVSGFVGGVTDVTDKHRESRGWKRLCTGPGLDPTTATKWQVPRGDGKKLGTTQGQSVGKCRGDALGAGTPPRQHNRNTPRWPCPCCSRELSRVAKCVLAAHLLRIRTPPPLLNSSSLPSFLPPVLAVSPLPLAVCSLRLRSSSALLALLLDKWGPRWRWRRGRWLRRRRWWFWRRFPPIRGASTTG